MAQENFDKRNYDIVSISQKTDAKPKLHVRNALIFDSTGLVNTGKFVNSMANIFKTKASQTRAVC